MNALSKAQVHVGLPNDPCVTPEFSGVSHEPSASYVYVVGNASPPWIYALERPLRRRWLHGMLTLSFAVASAEGPRSVHGRC